MHEHLGYLHGFKYYLLSSPRKVVGFKVVRYEVHPIIKFLSKFLPIDPWIEGQKPVYEESRIIRWGNEVYVDVEIWEALKKEAANGRV